MKVNDIVSRISYNHDVLFKINRIDGEIAYLKGISIRLEANAPISDLVFLDEEIANKERNKDYSRYSKIITNNKLNIKHLAGRILHIDSDPDYLKKSLDLYKQMGIYACGIQLNEESISPQIMDLIDDVNPDIVVLTGHDSYNKNGLKELKNYQHTNDFVEAIKLIRKKYSKDHILIFAGACQSNFEALIAAGANFASSPKRKNINLFDPAIIACKAAITPFNRIISIDEIITFTKGGKEAVNGIESYGKMRLLL